MPKASFFQIYAYTNLKSQTIPSQRPTGFTKTLAPTQPVTLLRGAFLSLLAVLALASGQTLSLASTSGCTSPKSPEAKAVKVTTQRVDGVTHFIVENNEFCEVTMTFEMALKNLKGENPFPYTATFPARQSTEAFTLSPIDPNSKWEYSFTNYYKLGSNCVRHDDSCVYQLPYGPGSKYKVTQGYNGKFSHMGANQYATDWQMPEGTLVLAARGGVVVRAKDDSDRGGSSMDYDRYNNYVLIRHDDGTLGHYCHLRKGGCLVKVGQKVSAGDAIAHSGNTGFSSGPHLHFCVFKTKDGKERTSIPVRFKTSEESSVTLLGGHAYRAPEIQTTALKSTVAVQAVIPLGR